MIRENLFSRLVKDFSTKGKTLIVCRDYDIQINTVPVTTIKAVYPYELKYGVTEERFLCQKDLGRAASKIVRKFQFDQAVIDRLSYVGEIYHFKFDYPELQYDPSRIKSQIGDYRLSVAIVNSDTTIIFSFHNGEGNKDRYFCRLPDFSSQLQQCITATIYRDSRLRNYYLNQECLPAIFPADTLLARISLIVNQNTEILTLR